MEANQIKVKVKNDSREATLLHWGISYEELRDGIGHCTIAIVAFEDGAIKEVGLRNMEIITDKRKQKLEAAASDMLKTLEQILNGCPPATAEEAFMFVDIAKSIAGSAIKKATE